MGFPLSQSVAFGNPVYPDNRQGKIVNGSASEPYDNLEDLLIATEGIRIVGLVMYVKDPADATKAKEYWFQGGVTENDLVEKIGTGGGLTISGTPADLSVDKPLFYNTANQEAREGEMETVTEEDTEDFDSVIQNYLVTGGFGSGF